MTVILRDVLSFEDVKLTGQKPFQSGKLGFAEFCFDENGIISKFAFEYPGVGLEIALDFSISWMTGQADNNLAFFIFFEDGLCELIKVHSGLCRDANRIGIDSFERFQEAGLCDDVGFI